MRHAHSVDAAAAGFNAHRPAAYVAHGLQRGTIFLSFCQLSEFPQELQECIIGKLPFDTLRTARLVRKSWNSMARSRLFHTIALTPTENGLEIWNNIQSSSALCEIPRKVIINSSPVPDYSSTNHTRDEYEAVRAWNPDPQQLDYNDDREQGEDEDIEDYESFQLIRSYYAAVDSIKSFANIDHAVLHFSKVCNGEETPPWWQHDEGCETKAFRNDLLRRFFAALHYRQRVGYPDVHTLTIENLQNDPDAPVTASEQFRSVMSPVKIYHLQVTEEYNPHGPDHDSYREDRRNFMPVLANDWLRPFQQIESLTLEFPDCWGDIPGTFNGSGLSFPNMIEMTLKERSLAHYDSMDWVLKQRSLQRLCLNQCFIPSYIRLTEEDEQTWHVATHDWQKLDNEEWGASEGDACYHFPGTWAMVFNKIRDKLPALREFEIRYGNGHGRYGHEDSDLFWRRYNHFDIGLLPSQWIDANWSGGSDQIGQNEVWESDKEINRHRETEAVDRAALDELMQTIRRRGTLANRYI